MHLNGWLHITEAYSHSIYLWESIQRNNVFLNNIRNQAEACFYISDHSDCELVVVENEEQLKKYLSIWDRLPKLKAIVVYNDANALKIVP